jgi:purine-binding chemotaxis protein CheW
MEKHILFKVGEEGFGISISQVVEIIAPQKPNPVPEVPGYISGVFTLRGDVIPLVDLRKRFGIKPSPRKERIIIIRSAKEKIGLLVDEVSEIRGFTDKELASTPGLFKGLKTEYLKGIARSENGVAMLLDIDRILSSEERILLKVA